MPSATAVCKLLNSRIDIVLTLTQDLGLDSKNPSYIKLINTLQDCKRDAKFLGKQIRSGLKYKTKMENKLQLVYQNGERSNDINNDKNKFGKPLCKYWKSGKCKFGDNCQNQHGKYVVKQKDNQNTNPDKIGNSMIDITSKDFKYLPSDVKYTALHLHTRNKRDENYVRPPGPKQGRAEYGKRLMKTLAPRIASKQKSSSPSMSVSNLGDTAGGSASAESSGSSDDDIRPTKRVKLLSGRPKGTAADKLATKGNENNGKLFNENNLIGFFNQSNILQSTKSGKKLRTFGGVNKRKTRSKRKNGGSKKGI